MIALLVSGLLLAQAAPTASTPGAAAPIAAAPAVEGAELSVALTPEHPTVGDRVTAVLTLEVAADRLAGTPTFPDWGESWGAAEVFEAGEPEQVSERGGVVTWRQRLEIAAFRPQPVPLPPVPVVVPLTTGTVALPTPERLTLQVSSVLPTRVEPSPGGAPDDAPAGVPGVQGEPGEAPELEPKPPAPPVGLPLGAAFLWTAALLGAACLGLLLLLWRRTRQSAGDAAGAPLLSPLAELERSLGTLSRTPTPVVAHVLLSKALRRYLSRRLGFPALESTTTEIRRQLRERHLPDEAAREAVELLGACDLVKFARRDDAPETLDRRSAAALGMARRIEEHFAPATPPAQVGPPAGTAESAGSRGAAS